MRPLRVLMSYMLLFAFVTLGGLHARAEGQEVAVLWKKHAANVLDPAVGFSQSQALAINKAGTIVGSSFNVGPDTARATVWDHGITTTLEPFGGLTGSVAYSISEAGHIAGVSRGFVDGVEVELATVWFGPDIFDVGTLPGCVRSEAMGVNATGVVVGRCFMTGESAFHGFVNDGQLRDLGALDGFPNVTPAAINDRALIAGSSLGPDGALAFTWKNGVISAAGREPDCAGSAVQNLNVNGDLVGVCYSSSGPDRGALWRAGRLFPLSTIDGLGAIGLGINQQRRIVGVLSSAETGAQIPVLWTQPQSVSALPLPAGYSRGVAADINDRDEIVGTAFAP